jgi:hypothetical protein
MAAVALTFFSSSPKASKPMTAVTNFFLFLSMRLMVTTLLASLSACFCSAASAFAAFFWASFAARFWASMDNDAVAASSASAGALLASKIMSSRTNLAQEE